MELAVDDDLLRKNPSKGCGKEYTDVKKKTALTVEQQRVFLEFVENSNMYRKYMPMFVFMIATGCRIGEVLGLIWDDIDFQKNQVTINHQLLYRSFDGVMKFYISSPKSNSGNRTIPLTNTVKTYLLKQRDEKMFISKSSGVIIDGYKDFVFVTGKGKPIQPHSIYQALGHIVDTINKIYDINFPRISAHILRHTGCTRMAESGMDPKVLQYIMGHSSIEVTMDVYNHIDEERSHREINRIDDVINL